MHHKDIKFCADCFFFGKPDKCLNPVVTYFDLVTGEERYPHAYAQRSSEGDLRCGAKAKFFKLHEEESMLREQRKKELAEAMRDAPTL